MKNSPRSLCKKLKILSVFPIANGLALINTLLEDAKLGALIAQVSQLIRSDGKMPNDSSTNDSKSTEIMSPHRSLPIEPPYL